MSGERQISLFETSRLAEPPSDGVADEPITDGTAPTSPLSVSALNAVVRKLLESSVRPLWIVGEVANWRDAASGHRYFSLRDEESQIACVMWQSDVRRLPMEPEEGMEVLAFGQVTVYPARGRYELVVRRLEARGEGLWRLAFERLRQKLAAEGLLDPGRKRPLPKIPQRVGVVTSRTGAALRDVLTVVRRRAPWTDVLVHDCRVQGEGAARDIARALEALGRHDSVDVVILTRGGGSVEDLWCFNEERVARAVAACPVPVISAVGHEVDVTMVDLVADRRAATPSAAAELAVPDGHELRTRMHGFSQGFATALRRQVGRGEELSHRLEESLLRTLDRRFERWDGRLQRMGDRLHALSPLDTLKRGYAVPLTDDGDVLRAVDAFAVGKPFHLRVVDGTVRARTEGKETIGPEESA
jgi:exodeoxyribonuclease VII large subunit